jgi:hypothetical protein
MGTSLSGGTNDNSFVRPDQYNRLANYAPTSFDRHQVLAVNYVYPIPRLKWGNSLTRLATDGWQLSGVTLAQTGAPFTPSVSVQNSSNPIITGSYTEGPRPVLIKGCNPYTNSGNWNNYLNPACFEPALPGSIGLESGINYLNAPGGVNFDMALQKEFGFIGEEKKLHIQFRVDAFNVFNHTIFTGVNSTLNFNAFPANSSGVITGLPAYTSTALATNNPAQGCTTNCNQIAGFGSLTQTSPGAFGYSRILQLLVRIRF